MGCSLRNIKLLVKRYRSRGAAGLISQMSGLPSNQVFPEDFKQQIMEHIASKYTDFGPTLAVEMLCEREKLWVSRETARAWMIEALARAKSDLFIIVAEREDNVLTKL